MGAPVAAVPGSAPHRLRLGLATGSGGLCDTPSAWGSTCMQQQLRLNTLTPVIGTVFYKWGTPLAEAPARVLLLADLSQCFA